MNKNEIDAKDARGTFFCFLGALKTLFGFVFGLFIILCLFTAYKALPGKDATDGYKRIAIYTDCETGVQYVSNFRGGMVVRVDEEGRPLKQDCRQ